MRMDHSGDTPKVMVTCFLCDREFQFGPHIYAGRGVASWGIQICKSCDNGNHDGLVIEHHRELVQHLADRGIAWKRNARGWVDIPR